MKGFRVKSNKNNFDNWPGSVMSHFTTHNGENIGKPIFRPHRLKSQG